MTKGRKTRREMSRDIGRKIKKAASDERIKEKEKLRKERSNKLGKLLEEKRLAVELLQAEILVGILHSASTKLPCLASSLLKIKMPELLLACILDFPLEYKYCVQSVWSI